MEPLAMPSGPWHVSASLKILLLVFCAVLLGTLTYFVWYQNTEPETFSEDLSTVPVISGSLQKDWETYQSPTYSFSIQHPKDWTVKESLVSESDQKQYQSAYTAKNIAGYCLYPTDPDPFDCYVGFSVWAGSLKDVVAISKGAFENRWPVWPLETVSLNGALAKKYVFSGEGESASLKQITYFIPGNNYVFQVGEEYQDSRDVLPDAQSNTEITNDIIRSFHLLEN